eukprot:CAMPEP_0114614982 /NCGR_PEP_ID=MMETSP0168-20121206/5932_1 /TAXON_ID=95228 ORGANISM="Vannella sp., Strain DIVA3 517/6/12" /NCGR_SAMPLE_ID=MMETSP0168 /ASSEMBLY_ACC=CAM_ASM_000044 /LENGTH=416 /DNA_ID=CAMNT_0001826043 /DNA_START=84 /DNA_END=1330 /DNA_ORIENTATION=+
MVVMYTVSAYINAGGPALVEDGGDAGQVDIEEEYRTRYSQREPGIGQAQLVLYLTSSEHTVVRASAFVLGSRHATAQGLFSSLATNGAIMGPGARYHEFYSNTERWLQGWELHGWMYRGPGQKLASSLRLVDPSARYLSAPFVAERIYLSVRESARFVVVLRDPVHRALDHFFKDREQDSSATDPFGYLMHPSRQNASLGETLVEELKVLQRCATFDPPPPSGRPTGVAGVAGMADMAGMDSGDKESSEEWIPGEGLSSKSPKDAQPRGAGSVSAQSREGMEPPGGYGLPSQIYSVVSDCLADCRSCFPAGTPHLVHDDGGLLSNGLYLELLEPYFAFFGRDNFHFVQFEELHSSPAKTAAILNEVCEFLGVPGMPEEEWGGALEVTDGGTRLLDELPEVDPKLVTWLSDFYRTPT